MAVKWTLVLVTIFLSVITLVCSLSYQCGPENVCRCSSCGINVTMDCTSAHVNIRDVCKAVDTFVNGSVNVLKVGENNLGRIGKNDLKGCEGLCKLDLHDNQIVSLPVDIFSNFRSIEELDLRNNHLNVYRDSFDQTVLPVSLKVLYIGGNLPLNGRITGMEPKYPNISNLQSLEALFMDGFQGEFGIAYKSLKVQNLSLSASTKYTTCNLSTITKSTFSNFVSLTSLDLSICIIENIHKGAFRNLAHLQILDLSLNRRLGFAPLKNLTFDLQFTNIDFLNYSYVYPTFGLGSQLLKRDICYLWNSSIKTIALDGNSIKLFETNAVILMPESLETLYVNDNKFTFGPYLSQLGCANNLRRCYGNYQNIYHTPRDYLFDPHDLEIRNRNTSSECPFMTTYTLKTIAKKKGNCAYLTSTDFIKIFTPTFPPKLENAEFHDSQMTFDFDVKFIIRPEDNNLKTVDFSGNVLYSLNGEIGPFPKIQHIDVSRIYCKYIGPKIFDRLTTVENLQLQQNYLGEFFADIQNDEVFKKLTLLKVLNLRANKITKLHSSTFASLVNLTELDLGSNNIEQFDIDLSSMKHLLTINLSVNFIRTLPLDVRKELTENANRLNKSFAIDLRNNSIDFTCNNKEFLEWLLDHRSNMIGFSDYSFSDDGSFFPGSELVGKIITLQKKCRSYTLPIVLGAMGVSIFLSILIGGVIYKKRWKIRYFMYMSKARYFGYRRLDDDTVVENYKRDAFISYAEDDIRFVRDQVIPKLEDDRGLMLCVHQRDFLPGNDIADNIIGAIKESRKTVVILSKRFLKKKWCMYEFNMARMESIYSRGENGCLIIVMLEDVPTKDIPLEMMEWIRTNSYIEYTTDPEGQMIVWNNLETAISA